MEDSRGCAGSPGIFTTINGRSVVWRDGDGALHSCEGADVHQEVRLIWTQCGKRDVPTAAAFHPEIDDCVTCPDCLLGTPNLTTNTTPPSGNEDDMDNTIGTHNSETNESAMISVLMRDPLYLKWREKNAAMTAKSDKGAAAKPFLTLPGGGTVIPALITETKIEIDNGGWVEALRKELPPIYNLYIYTNAKQGPTVVKFSRKSEVLLFADKLNRLRANCRPVIHWHEL